MSKQCKSCGSSTVGKSSYCREHREESRKRWSEMMKEQAKEKEERAICFQELWEKGCLAGDTAVTIAEVEMIQITGYAPFPICGFAWVTVRPGNCQFANWLKKNGHGKIDSFAGGVTIWISSYGQSCDRKYAYAKGMAKVFSDAGIKAYALSRLD